MVCEVDTRDGSGERRASGKSAGRRGNSAGGRARRKPDAERSRYRYEASPRSGTTGHREPPAVAAPPHGRVVHLLGVRRRPHEVARRRGPRDIGRSRSPLPEPVARTSGPGRRGSPVVPGRPPPESQLPYIQRSSGVRLAPIVSARRRRRAGASVDEVRRLRSTASRPAGRGSVEATNSRSRGTITRSRTRTSSPSRTEVSGLPVA